MDPEYPQPNDCDPSVTADLLFRQEPDEDENDTEGDDKEEDDGEEGDDGYSE